MKINSVKKVCLALGLGLGLSVSVSAGDFCSYACNKATIECNIDPNSSACQTWAEQCFLCGPLF